MLRHNVLWTQWVLLAVFGSAVLLIAFVLAWWPFWQTRRNVEEEGPLRGWHGFRLYMPWVLILTYVSTLAASVIYGIAKAMNPPNW